jgi:hypothetical protein
MNRAASILETPVCPGFLRVRNTRFRSCQNDTEHQNGSVDDPVNTCLQAHQKGE